MNFKKFTASAFVSIHRPTQLHFLLQSYTQNRHQVFWPGLEWDIVLGDCKYWVWLPSLIWIFCYTSCLLLRM